MSKETSTWYSPRLKREITVARWGAVGQPVLLFPTAAGDAEECERFLMIKVLADQLEKQKIKLYSVDSVPGQVWLSEDNKTTNAGRVQNQFDAALYHEVVPAIRTDCKSPEAEIVVAGASIGAFQAAAAICRHPDVFKLAICMSGTYDLTKKILQGPVTADFHHASPLNFLPQMPENDVLTRLRQRFVLITHGTGRWEEPAQSWQLANALGKRNVPNRVDEWTDYDHDWPTWREMLPKYLGELVT